MEKKNITRNIVPSIAVMVVGLVGAFFVYNVYFGDTTASSVASLAPAAGEEHLADAAADMAESYDATAMDETAMDAADSMMDEAEAAMDHEKADMADEAAEAMHADSMEDAMDDVVDHAEDAMENAADHIEDVKDMMGGAE